MKSSRCDIRRWLAALAGLVLGFMLCSLIAIYVSPWPSVWIVRAIFDHGAAQASTKLEKHLPQNVLAQTGIQYDVHDEAALLDIYRPSSLAKRAPVVVWIHGGGFVSGRRGDLTNYLKILASQGFLVVNVDYTIAPAGRYPAPVEQIGKALRFLDQSGDLYGMKDRALVLAGDSAGAQLAAQMANLITSPAYSQAVGIAAPVQPERLVGSLLYCGIFDVESLGQGRGGLIGWFLRTVTWSYSGARDWRSVSGFELFSVAQFVTPAYPASFISAGNADPLAPQSHQMYEALRSRGVPVESLFYPDSHPSPLGHEYQFDLDSKEGQAALSASVKWLTQLPVASAADQVLEQE